MNRQVDFESEQGKNPKKPVIALSRTAMLAVTGMFAALVFLTTWALHVPAGIGGGYVHFGDAIVYLAASFLPPVYAMPAAAVGAGLSDLATPGAALWILPTVIIKSLCCLPFTYKGDRILCRRNIAAVIVAGIISAVGYGAVTAVIAGSVAVAVSEIPLSFIQSGGSAVCFIALSAALDKTKLKNMMWGGDK